MQRVFPAHSMMNDMTVTVLGAGSWGTTLASLITANTSTLLWCRSQEVAEEISTERLNSRYTGDRRLPSRIRVTTDLNQAVSEADVLVVAVPTQHIRTIVDTAADSLRPWIPIVSLAKGLEVGTHLRPTEIINERLPGHPVGLLAGPNIAHEIQEGKPAAAVLAMPDPRISNELQPVFSRAKFRVYTNQDVIGCELGGVLKNIIAIAAGMANGLAAGMNVSAMVISRGLAEITRLGVAMGAEPETFAGLTGLGDLVATCMSPYSRNRQVGEGLAEGRSIDEIVDHLGHVAEGVKTVRSVVELAEELGVPVPICSEIDSVINEGQSPSKTYRTFLRLQPTTEAEIG